MILPPRALRTTPPWLPKKRRRNNKSDKGKETWNARMLNTYHILLGRLASLMVTLGAAARPASAISSLKSPIESGNCKQHANKGGEVSGMFHLKSPVLDTPKEVNTQFKRTTLATRALSSALQWISTSFSSILIKPCTMTLRTNWAYSGLLQKAPNSSSVSFLRV